MLTVNIMFALVVALPAAGLPTSEAVVDSDHYRPPVDAPVVDRFRPPEHIGGSGNRGLEYSTAPGTEVRAAKAGQVTFAGQVGGTLHVTVAHSDGLRTSYSFLRSIAVARGQFVLVGHVLGHSGERLHFGVRDGGTYLDPALLLAPMAARARLVAVGRRAEPTVHFRRGLAEGLNRQKLATQGRRR